MSADKKRTYFSPTFVCLFFAAFSMEKTSCITIERRVTSKSTLPYPSADSFKLLYNVRCSFDRRSCEKLGAKCSGSSLLRCCTCKCLGHNPNFFSSQLGCQSMYSLGTHSVTRCLYALENSEGRYVPTFSSHTDFRVRDIKLQMNAAQWNSVLLDGSCTASAVSYIDSQGRKRLLFENRCSEIFEIEKRIDNEKVVHQLLKWKRKVQPFTYFHKMQGKLLTMDITCDNTKGQISSCLLFKVAGLYNDRKIYSAVESPSSCPKKELLTSTRTPARKSTTKFLVKKTTELLQLETTISATSNDFRTKRPFTINNTEPSSGIHPPASLPDGETRGTGTERAVPGIEKTVATNEISDSGTTFVPSTTWKRNRNEGENSEVSSKLQSKHGINWLVTGLIIAVAVLLITLAASLFVLLRKRCKKSAQRNSGEFAMNIVYHGSAAGPEYEEATLPSKLTCSNDELNCYNDGNLYESIDNLAVIGATAGTYEYAYTDASKVKLPDENDNKDQPQQPPIPGPVQNKYEVAFRMRPDDDTCNSPVVEEYEDMTLTASEKVPLVTERQKYVNLHESMPKNAESGTDEPSQQVYEKMESITAAEEEPLVSESYVAPDSISTLS